MSIQIINETLSTIKIAINHWGKDGKTNFFPIKPNDSGSWKRSSDHGFIMMVENTNHDGPWYIEKGVTLKFHEDGSFTSSGRSHKIAL